MLGRRIWVRVGTAVLVASALGAVGATTGTSSARAAGGSTSGNWAGYVASGAGVTEVHGTWTVPAAGLTPPGSASTWVGIGGVTSKDLIQAGTQELSTPYAQFINGGAYAAWYEILPAAPVIVGGPVAPGDKMTVAITNGGGDNWAIDIADATAGWTYTTNLTYTSSEDSAEWIHEAPSLAGAVPIPVSGRETVTFDGGNGATVGQISGNPQQLNASPWNTFVVESTPSSLDSDGDGFNVCTYALSCSPPSS